MVESAMFSVASKLLSTIASPAFKKAYESVCSIWYARDELTKLKRSIQTIQAVLLDAEKRQRDSEAIKDWIKRVRDVLHDADDLFDEVTTDDMLQQKIMEGDSKLHFLKEMRVSCSKLNPIASINSIAKKVKAIRKSLHEISIDMTQFQFVSCLNEYEIPIGSRRGQDPGSFVDSKDVIGRDEDKKAVLEMLFNESNVKPDDPLVIAIVGIGGMGKTTLAQFIYNDVEVQKKFEKNWFACISNTSNEMEVLGKICQAIHGENYNSFTLSQLQSKIRESITDNNNFLLVLDDVWDDHHGRWQARMRLLSGGAKGSTIIVTTRSSSVAASVDASSTHTLGGLSESDSWGLFKRVAFAPGNENDPRRVVLGKEIMKKCRNVPLAIKSIASLLFEKNTIQEWESIRNEKLEKLGGIHDEDIIPVLKLSYDHLPSNLKQCFAYCSLFPEDYVIGKDKLLCLWIAQGYIRSNSMEEGHSCFMYLFRRGFFEKAKEDDVGEIQSCKMHDLIHDLAQYVAGEESVMLSTSTDIVNCMRHASVGVYTDNSWGIPASLINENRLRSFLFMKGGSICKPVLDELLRSFKLLRTLCLTGLRVDKIPSCIGEIKHLRYLDLSRNGFESVPDSMTNLLNLLVLNLERCEKLKGLPDNFRKLINLRYLDITNCRMLKHMPPGIGELSCLEYLSNFKVGKSSEGVKMSGIDALSRLQQLRGCLEIWFNSEIDNWVGDECWQLPVFLQKLFMYNYPGGRIPTFQPNARTNLASLDLRWCYNVKYLPPLKCLLNLKFLSLWHFAKLEYVEEEEEFSNASTSTFFPVWKSLNYAICQI